MVAVLANISSTNFRISFANYCLPDRLGTPGTDYASLLVVLIYGWRFATIDLDRPSNQPQVWLA